MIVEDEVHILKYMQKKLSAFEEFQVKGAFSTPEEALAAFDEIQPEVVFLDIEMPRMNGLELAGRLLDKKQELRIIFTTAYGQYAVDAFKVEAVDYLMKPIADEDILRVMKRLKKGMQEKLPQKADRRSEIFVPVRCFGCFDVRDQHRQMVSWPTRRAEELFAYFLTHQGQYVSKWEILELFWPDMDEERGLHNLYNTIYRIKQVLKNLPLSPQIQKVNDGYILESEEGLSDLGQLFQLMEKGDNDIPLSIEEAAALFFSYAIPLFGTRDYLWSFSTQEYAARLYTRLCNRLLHHYREQNRFQQAEEVVRHYVLQHVEDETMMVEWLRLLENWRGHEEKVLEYQRWFNEKLKVAELPPI